MASRRATERLVRRPRRLRASPGIRRLTTEVKLTPADLILPIFVRPGEAIREAVESMPGVLRLSVDQLEGELKEALGLGIPGLLLFGLPSSKDELASEAHSGEGAVQKAVRRITSLYPELVVMTDVCLCEYTTHGHCGLIKEGLVDNDSTLEVLSLVAVSHAEAGAHVVAPSGMMDGQVRALREALDDGGFKDTAIMSYSAKHASSLYMPFREAAESAPSFGDRTTYQMNPANPREAMMEIALDIEEGADMVMVKPALAYLDVIYRARQRFDIPLAAYSVSGEYAMVKAASKLGWVDEAPVMLEMLTGIKRAGADIIITYAAREAARWITASEM